MQLTSLEDTIALAKTIAQSSKTGDIITLSGDLGTGKTTFAQAFINEKAGKDCHVTSPTFTLLQTYDTENNETIWHYDLYRVEKEQDLYELGIEEALDTAISLIEWPQIAENLLPKNNRIDITLAFSETSPTARTVTITQSNKQ